MEGRKLARPSALKELWANVKESLLGFKRVYGWIEIGVKDMGRAIKWYCGAFRLERVTNGSDPERVHLGRDSGDGAKHTMIPLVPIREGRTEPSVDRASDSVHEMVGKAVRGLHFKKFERGRFRAIRVGTGFSV